MTSHFQYFHQIAEISHLHRYKIYGHYSFLSFLNLWRLVISNTISERDQAFQTKGGISSCSLRIDVHSTESTDLWMPLLVLGMDILFPFQLCQARDRTATT